jgi:uncharacterized protein YlxW (UPF0749 family)
MKIRRYHVYLTFVTLTTGFLISNSIELTKERESVKKNDQRWVQVGQLNEQILAEKQANESLEEQLLELQQKVAVIEETLAKRESEAKEILTELDAARMLAGVLAVEGPGVEVTLRDNPDAGSSGDISNNIVHEQDVTLVVNELRAAGAEAIAVNGQRVVSNTAIRCVGPTIIVNGVKSAAPFVVTAIGNPIVLEGALKLPGGVIDGLDDFIKIEVVKKDRLELPAYVGESKFDTTSS